MGHLFIPTSSLLESTIYAQFLSPSQHDVGPTIVSDGMIVVSVDIPLYKRGWADPEDWNKKWWFASGSFHPYMLTWQVDENLEADTREGTQTLRNYTMPHLSVIMEMLQPSVYTAPLAPAIIRLLT